MKFVIKDEIRGRMRVRVKQNEMTCREADILQYYFDGQKCVTKVKVNERVNDVVICYSGSRSHVTLSIVYSSCNFLHLLQMTLLHNLKVKL